MRPDAGTPAPALALAGGEAVRPVWVNELGGITFEIGTAGRRRFVKWAPAGSGLDLAADGRCSGQVDLGELGVADRWADLAVATWSTTWNYGPGWETRCSTPTASPRTRSAPATTACSGTWARDRRGGAQTKADRPVMARPTTRVLISRVPS